MSGRRLMLVGPLLWLAGAALAGCAGPPAIDDPAGTAFVNQFLAFLANPNVAYLLLVLGLLAVIAEVTTPGAVVPGVTGAIMLILSLYGMLHLPTNWLGPVLMIAGVVMLLLDLKVTGFALSIGGTVAFLIGSLLIFTPPWVQRPASALPAPTLSPWLVIGTTLAVALFIMFALAAAIKAQRWPVAVGRETLVGKVGVAQEDLRPSGTVRVEGEQWTAENVTGEEIPSGTNVRVTGIDGLRLRVERDWGAARWSERTPWPRDSSDTLE